MIRTKNKHRRSGAALVEMALVLPIFVTVVLGIVEFGRAMMVSQLVTNSAREGARMGIIDGSTNTDVTNRVKTFLQSAINVSGSDVTVTITVTPAAGNDNPNNQVGASQPGDLVSIKVSVPFNKVCYVKGKWLTGKNLVGQALMRHE